MRLSWFMTMNYAMTARREVFFQGTEAPKILYEPLETLTYHFSALLCHFYPRRWSLKEETICLSQRAKRYNSTIAKNTRQYK